MPDAFDIRKPTRLEWPVCRMLLPETVADAPARDYLLAIQAAQGTIAGAISYRDNGIHLLNLRMHVVRGAEQTSAGSRLIRAVFREAEDRGRLAVETRAEESREPALHRFFLEHGFEVKSRLFTAEGSMDRAYAYLDRMRQAGGLRRREGVEVVPLSRPLLSEAGRLYAEHISHLPEQTSAYVYFNGDLKHFGLTQVLLIDGSVQGLMLTSRTGDTATVHARVVRDSHRRGWASAELFLNTIERLREAGIRRLRFQFFESTYDTSKLTKRLHMQTIARTDLLSCALLSRALPSRAPLGLVPPSETF